MQNVREPSTLLLRIWILAFLLYILYNVHDPSINTSRCSAQQLAQHGEISTTT